jgi:hypothetical protein
MDDFSISSLHESKNEWGARLLTILTPLVIEGLKSIFEEAVLLCKSNNEMGKYLMTFQNFITRIPKWNSNIINIEKKRILERSGCGYLEELVTCVHIIQLKLLTAIRVGQKKKKIDINIPKLDDFIHNIYINVARKIYKNVYLFELNIPPLQIQKNQREMEIIIQECILNTIRESIPVESILRAYMDETTEEEIIEEIKEEVIETPTKNERNENIENTENNMNTKHKEINELHTSLNSKLETVELPIVKKFDSEVEETEFPILPEDTSNISRLSFNDVDMVKYSDNVEEKITAPKTVERLEQISDIRNAQRKEYEDVEKDEDEPIKLNILDQDASLDNLDIHVIDQPEFHLNEDNLLNDIEILE